MEFKVGDIVKINKEATINDLVRNHWNGCQIDTLDFLRYYADQDKKFIVKESSRNYVVLRGHTNLVNINILTLVRHQAKKMTVSEICKELGYEVEIVKEKNN